LFKTKELQAVAKIESSLLRGCRRYFEDSGFIEINVPHLTKATGACENFYTVFEVNFFGGKKYLAQTGQLYLETLTPFLKRVWCIGPSFRAEDEVDGRHLVEFPLIEIEHEGYFDELLVHIENTITSMVQEVLRARKDELDLLGIDKGRLEKVKPPFQKITYTNTIKLLSENGFDVRWGDDLKSHHEKKVVELLGHVPVFITHFPKAIKFFNMKQDDANPAVVKSADLILPFSGEAVGAAEREHEHGKLLQRLKESAMLKMLLDRGGRIEDFDWFLDFYKSNESIPHSGCGIGFNRVTQFVLGTDDIRTATVYPLNRESVL